MKRLRVILFGESRWLRSGLRKVGILTAGLVFAVCFGLGTARAQSTEAGNKTDSAGTENCASCHGEKLRNYQHSAHGEAKVGCLKCHTVHPEGVKPGKQSGNQKLMLKSDEKQLCLGCHGEVGQDFQKAHHHNVSENEKAAGGDEKLRCSDCHDPHDVAEKKGLKKAAHESEVCLKCHKELAGPFEFEHAALKGGGCTICHFAHGGRNNPKLLRRTTVNALCTECHMPAVNIKGRVVQGHILNAQSAACTSCHVEIHGSHESEVFFNATQ